MANSSRNNFKLGVFILSGLAFLILMLYMIGRNRNLFQSTYTLKAHIRNAQGLVTGNNVRYAGIEVGTVNRITFINDSTIELSLIINSKMKNIIKKNATVSVGTEGFVGNKVLNISSLPVKSATAEEGDILSGGRMVNTDEMLFILENTNRDVADIAEGLKVTVDRLNSSQAFWRLLDDRKLATNLTMTLSHLKAASSTAADFFTDLKYVSSSLREGNGVAGTLLTDTTEANAIKQAISDLANAARDADSLTRSLQSYVNQLHTAMASGNNTIGVLLTDTMAAHNLSRSIMNVEKGTASFTENMEALKHNVLFRRYFRKQEKARKR